MRPKVTYQTPSEARGLHPLEFGFFLLLIRFVADVFKLSAFEVIAEAVKINVILGTSNVELVLGVFAEISDKGIIGLKRIEESTAHHNKNGVRSLELTYRPILLGNDELRLN